VEEFAASHPGLKDNTQVDFLRNFRFSDADLAAFRRHAQGQGVSLSPAEWERAKEDIRFLLKQTLADKIWGGGTGFKVQVYRDRRLIEALGMMDQAQAMLDAAYPPGVLP
jgi:hypothetical protein